MELGKLTPSNSVCRRFLNSTPAVYVGSTKKGGTGLQRLCCKKTMIKTQWMVECLYIHVNISVYIYIYITFVASLHTVPSSYLCYLAVSGPDLAVAPPESESMPESIKAWSASKSAESMTCRRSHGHGCHGHNSK